MDDLHLIPAQCTHPFGHGILQVLTFLILPYLLVAGLPQVDDGFTSQMFRLNLGMVQDLCHHSFLPLRERPPPERGHEIDQTGACRCVWAPPRFRFGSSGPEVLVASRRPPLHPSIAVCRTLS